jgi:hypothetical protein
MNPCILQDNILGHMLAKFMMGMFPMPKWERLISEAIVYNQDEKEEEK